MPVRVEIAETPAQYADGGRLFREYADFLGVDLGFQDFAGEMAALPVMYGPPDGSLLLSDDHAGALYRISHRGLPQRSAGTPRP